MKKKHERGALIVEATIVFPVMFFVVFFMIYAGNAYYQKCRVEAVINKGAMDGAAYCADPQLQTVWTTGKVPGLSSMEVYPYRFFSSTGVGNVEADIQTRIEKEIKGMSSGLFAGMKPTDVTVQTNFSNGILYATFSVDASYKITNPIRLLGDTENIDMNVRTHVEMPVADSAELIRNIDLVWDYMERFGAAQEIEKMVNAAQEWFNR